MLLYLVPVCRRHMKAMVTIKMQLRKPMKITFPSKFVISPLLRNMRTIKENETGYPKCAIRKRFENRLENRRERIFLHMEFQTEKRYNRGIHKICIFVCLLSFGVVRSNSITLLEVKYF